MVAYDDLNVEENLVEKYDFSQQRLIAYRVVYEELLSINRRIGFCLLDLVF